MCMGYKAIVLLYYKHNYNIKFQWFIYDFYKFKMAMIRDENESDLTWCLRL